MVLKIAPQQRNSSNQEDTEPEDLMRYADVISHDRYKVVEYINRGCWGEVYSAQDRLTGMDVAIKILNPTEIALRQMQDRNLNLEEAIEKEASELQACAHVVPRKFEEDANGRRFIVMPLYKRFLSDILGEGCRIEFEPHKHYDHTITPETGLRYLTSIASGLAEMHTKMRRAHSDLKPDNLAVDEMGEVLLGDLGTATCISLGMSKDERSNMGFVYTRAPECFLDESHPRKQSDVWSFGSLMYRLFTGKYVLQDELDNAKDPVLYMRQLPAEAMDTIIGKKLKENIPKPFRKIMQKMLYAEPSRRFYDGSALKSGLEEAIDKQKYGLRFWRNMKTWFLPISGVVGISSLIAYCAATHEPTKPTPAENNRTVVISALNDNHPNLQFDIEDIPNLPTKLEGFMMHNSRARKATDNRYVAHLVDAYYPALVSSGGTIEPSTNIQKKTYDSHTTQQERAIADEKHGPLWPVVAKSIEMAIFQARNSDGKIDLEDVLVISRLGIDAVNEAKRIAGSSRFVDYTHSKGSDGKYIIPENEIKFIRQWLAYLK